MTRRSQAIRLAGIIVAASFAAPLTSLAGDQLLPSLRGPLQALPASFARLSAVVNRDNSGYQDSNTLRGNGYVADVVSDPSARLTNESWRMVYDEAAKALKIGTEFRSSTIQRLDPDNCTENNDNPDVCSFVNLEILSQYQRLVDSPYYWRFCADYDESVLEDTADPTHTMELDEYGYCPAYDTLTEALKATRRPTGSDPPTTVIDIRNHLVEARRLFAELAVLAPPDLSLTDAANSPTLRTLGRDGVLNATRELANVHMIFGHELTLEAQRHTQDVASGQTPQDALGEEIKLLERAVHQYELAADSILLTLNLNLGGPNRLGVRDLLTPTELDLFAAASRSMVDTVVEIGRRTWMLEVDGVNDAGRNKAVQRLDEAFRSHYLQVVALADQASKLEPDNPNTPDVDEGRKYFLDNGGWQILNTLNRLAQQTQEIRAGANILGYEEDYVPVNSFSALSEFANTAVDEAQVLLEKADFRGRDFDQSRNALADAVDELSTTFVTQLTDLCGKSNDDWETCTQGAMLASKLETYSANKEVALAWQEAQQVAEEIKDEQTRAGKVINVTLGTADKIKAYDLAIGKLEAYRETRTAFVSNTETMYAELEASTTASTKATAKASTNPSNSELSVEASVEVAVSAKAGYRDETTYGDTSEQVWDPNAEVIREYESLKSLAEAERDAKIEGANSEKMIKDLLRKQSNELLEYEIQLAVFNRAVAEHNALVQRYLLLLNQRAAARSDLLDSYLRKPYFRLMRDKAVEDATRANERAVGYAFLAAKALEFQFLTPVDNLEGNNGESIKMRDLYQARNAGQVRVFVDRIKDAAAPVLQGDYTRGTYRLSLARDILGLTDEALSYASDPAAERRNRLNAFLAEHRYTPGDGTDKIVIRFATLLGAHTQEDVTIDRLTRDSTQDLGCGQGKRGCKGIWFNVVMSKEDEARFHTRPRLELTHGGVESFVRAMPDRSLQVVLYDPGRSVLPGQALPPGWGSEVTRDILESHINMLDPDDPKVTSSKFYSHSPSTSNWELVIDLTKNENRALAQVQIEDVELHMDHTYFTPNWLYALKLQLAALRDRQQAGDADAADRITAIEARLRPHLAVADADPHTPSSRCAYDPEMDGQRPLSSVHSGLQFVTAPVNFGTWDLGLELNLRPDGSIDGDLRSDCTPLYDQRVQLSGTHKIDPETSTTEVAFTTDEFTTTVSVRPATRQLACKGKLEENDEVVQGTCVETITGLTVEPIQVASEIVLARLASNAPSASTTPDPNVTPTVTATSTPIVPPDQRQKVFLPFTFRTG